MTLNCIAVDDEPLALGLVSKFIEQTPFLNLAGKYASAVDALKAIHSQKIDLERYGACTCFGQKCR
jgi:two-component system response regulator LytT